MLLYIEILNVQTSHVFADDAKFLAKLLLWHKVFLYIYVKNLAF